jgi:transcriptional regulator with XRE-family HTH domain
MSETSTKIGKAIRALRESKKLSQERFAFKCGLHRTYISDVERGTRNVSVESLEKIAKALKIKVKDLFE